MRRIQGSIEIFFHDKHYGFAWAERDGEWVSYFFHQDEVQKADVPKLKKGVMVEFTPVETQRGPKGVEVRVVEAGHEEKGES